MGTSEKHLKSNIHMLRILRACICFKPDLYRYAEAKSFHPVKPFNEIQKNSQLARHPWNASLKNRRNIQPSSDITNFDSWKRFEIDFFFVFNIFPKVKMQNSKPNHVLLIIQNVRIKGDTHISYTHVIHEHDSNSKHLERD